MKRLLLSFLSKCWSKELSWLLCLRFDTHVHWWVFTIGLAKSGDQAGTSRRIFKSYWGSAHSGPYTSIRVYARLGFLPYSTLTLLSNRLTVWHSHEAFLILSECVLRCILVLRNERRNYSWWKCHISEIVPTDTVMLSWKGLSLGDYIILLPRSVLLDENKNLFLKINRYWGDV